MLVNEVSQIVKAYAEPTMLVNEVSQTFDKSFGGGQVRSNPPLLHDECIEVNVEQNKKSINQYNTYTQ